MKCEVVEIRGDKPGQKVKAIICRSGRAARRCAYCASAATKLCDFVMGVTIGGTELTCDKPLCRSHAYSKRGQKGKDFCMKHSL